MRDLPLLSVIVPVYNGADTLPDAIASIQQQTGATLEIIVVDDGSTDASAAVARACGQAITCVTQTNQGPAAARNHGLQLAHGAFVGFLDADDIWPADRVRHHLEIFEQTPATEIVIGTTKMVHLSPTYDRAILPIMPAPTIQHQLGSATFRRQVFARVGLFDPALLRGEDSDWFRRALRMGVPIRLTRTIAVEYRMREGSLTYGTLNHAHWFLAALRADLQRRRRSASDTDLASEASA